MYQHQIEEMSRKIAESLKLNKNDYKKVEKALIEYWKNQIAITWTVSDVRSVADGKGKSISDDEAMDILDNILHKHDASVGVNWDVINAWMPE